MRDIAIGIGWHINQSIDSLTLANESKISGRTEPRSPSVGLGGVLIRFSSGLVCNRFLFFLHQNVGWKFSASHLPAPPNSPSCGMKSTPDESDFEPNRQVAAGFGGLTKRYSHFGVWRSNHSAVNLLATGLEFL